MSGQIVPEVLRELRQLLGSAGLREGEAVALLDPGIDTHNLDARLLALPATREEVAAVVRLCSRHGIPVVPHGGRTGLAHGARSHPGDLVIGTSRLDRVGAVDVANATVHAEAGVTLARVAAAAAPHGLCPGIDLGARESCTIGGMISTNAGGMDAFRFGTMRNRVLGLEAVLADGTIVSDLTAVAKSNTGLDVKQLLIGSEGTLGIVTSAVLRLEPATGPVATVMGFVPDLAAAARLLRRLQAEPSITLTRAELMSRNHVALSAEAHGLTQLRVPACAAALLLEASGLDGGSALEAALEGALADGLLVDAVLPKSARELAEIWRMREDWAVERRYPGALWYDVSVPLGGLDTYLRRLEQRLAALDPGLGLYYVGHLGDGNLHLSVNAEQPVRDRSDEISPIVYDGLVAIGGSFSAEHGIGLEKKTALVRYGDPGKLAMMRAIKKALDPRAILNPGKVLD